MSRSHRLVLALSAAVVLSSLAVADDLPPSTAPAFSGVYHLTSRARAKAQDDWTYTVDDMVSIAVGKTRQARWGYKSDGRTTLIDQVARTSTTFGAKGQAPNTAVRAQSPFTPIGWEFGYETVLKAIEGKPEVLGQATIAGKECTRIRLTSEQYGEPEYCVTKTGIVLRFTNKSSTAETTYEAQSVDESTPDEKLFATPAGMNVEEKGPPKKPRIM